jgi:flavin-dependent dehydrogenase
VTFLGGCPAEVGAVEGPVRGVTVRAGSRRVALAAALVIDACGLRRPGGERIMDVDGPDDAYVGVAANIGSVSDLDVVPPHTITMACGPTGYAGTVRLERGTVRVAAALSPAAVRPSGGPGRAVASILHASGLAWAEAAAEATWRGTPRLTRMPTRVAASRLMLVGDAAGYVEPFTGEGIGWALASGREAAPIAAAAVHDRDRCSQAPEDAWAAAHERLLARRHRRCRMIARSLRHPLLVRTAVALAARSPALTRPIVRRFGAVPSGVFG